MLPALCKRNAALVDSAELKLRVDWPNATFQYVSIQLNNGTLGRLVNDENKSPNCSMKKIIVDREPHLCLFTITNIEENDQLLYS